MKPSGIVTLLTDFGVSDPYAAVMKGVVLSSAPHARVIDITHGVPPQDVITGSVFLGATVRHFPPGCVHVAVVDPGVGGPRRAVAVRTSRNWYVAPDNGVLTEALADEGVAEAVDITGLTTGREVSSTFHGRDLFAPVAAMLTNGAALATLGPDAAVLATVESGATGSNDGGVRGRVLFADRFGNLVTNVRRRDVPDGIRAVSVGASPPLAVGPPVSHYASVQEGAMLTIWNSYDLLEVALAGGNMAERVRWRAGQTLGVTVTR